MPLQDKSNDFVRGALDLGSFAFSHIDGFVVLTASIVCAALGAVLWGG